MIDPTVSAHVSSRMACNAAIYAGTQARLGDLLETVFQVDRFPLLIAPFVRELRSLSDFHRIVTRHVVRYEQ